LHTEGMRRRAIAGGEYWLRRPPTSRSEAWWITAPQGAAPLHELAARVVASTAHVHQFSLLVADGPCVGPIGRARRVRGCERMEARRVQSRD